ncbi:MAG: peptidoglycan DD-metalloendopeptidase family protein [Rubrivivax sp.]|jgi:lipoprotein NlpD|nr:peptidoglycan DD-metalloendopeptidase family protein [Rubrivivax sp.]
MRRIDPAAATGRAVRALFALVAAVLLAGCAGPKAKAPVEQRPAGSRPAAQAPASGPPPAPASDVATDGAPAAADAAGRPGFYTVRPGDTLIRIALDNGQNWRDVARWNNLDNPNLIEVGQVLRVVPPGVEAAAATSRPVTPPTRTDARPLPPGESSAAAPQGTAGPVATPAASAATSSPSAAPQPPIVERETDADIQWAWPAAGVVTVAFEEGRSKGLGIGGRAGDPVLAAADGRVVYAGSGLRGYGNLVIIKHNNTFLSAYAHNQVLLVREDQAVRRGQKIAEMGSTDSDRVQLHFEIRRQGRPVDPVRLLPPR